MNARPNCSRFTYSELMKELEIRNHNQTEEKALNDLIKELEESCEMLLRGDVNGALSKIMLDEELEPTLENLHQEVKSLMNLVYEFEDVHKRGNILAKAVLLVGRTHWLREQYPVRRVQTVHRWACSIVQAGFNIQIEFLS